ncbi:MAG TPA: polysaccharide deacetylase family protein [Gemmatimonadales bacterium]|nr:polysaccharide deacetylase family protein [Gemmatimonadales bacterium]
MSQLTASVSLDTDNLWSYLKVHGDAGWEAYPSYLARLVPRALSALDQLDLRITFFIVGRDAAQAPDRAVLRDLTRAGHEIGNHSYHHEPWLHRYTPAEIDAEIGRAHDAIAQATGVEPTGFRGPGFSWSPDLLEVLAARGYQFDASTLPTFIGPLARAYYFRTAKLSPDERQERAMLFGRLSEGFRPVRPYEWALPSGRRLLEIPVTTMPGLRVPFHLTYLLYLARVSEPLMRAYLRTALAACRLAGIGPSFLLHPLDLLSGDEVPELRFFPGMDLPSERKRALFVRVLTMLRDHFTLAPMGVHAAVIRQRAGIRMLRPLVVN